MIAAFILIGLLALSSSLQATPSLERPPIGPNDLVAVAGGAGYLATDHGLYMTSSLAQGSAFQLLGFEGVPLTSLHLFKETPATLLVGTACCGAFIATDNGAEKLGIQKLQVLGNHIRALTSRPSSGEIIVSTERGVFLSQDQGAYFKSISKGLPDGAAITLFKRSAENPDRVYGFMREDTACYQWLPESQEWASYQERYNVKQMSVQSSKERVESAFAFTGGQDFVFGALKFISLGTPKDFYEFPDGEVFAATRLGGGVKVNQKGRFRWISRKVSLNGETIHAVAQDPGTESTIFVVTDKGVLVSKNRGKDWEPAGDLPVPPVPAEQ